MITLKPYIVVNTKKKADFSNSINKSVRSGVQWKYYNIDFKKKCII